MPLYEYRCRSCRRRFTRFFRSIQSARDPESCPQCGASEVDRLVSRVVVRRSGREAGSGLTDWDESDGGGLSEDAERWGDEDDAELPDLPETEDPRELARWMRQMSAETGEPLDEPLERAIQDLERGEDPERVLERLGEEAGEPREDVDGQNEDVI
ncbi:MAG: hypothetical protein NZ696_00345 [Thermomicrobium sp.]|nr:hypothetical protein [Thermomicrobium sp.]MDW7981720.1 FmdB family zinc ribbon protein [Thermomicrobium sp.]